MEETSLPDDLLNYIDQNIKEYTEKLKTCEENCDVAIKSVLREITQSHQEIYKEHDRAQEHRKKLEKDIDMTKESIVAYEQKIAQAKERVLKASKVKEQEEQLKRDTENNDDLQRKIDELRLHLQQKQSDMKNKKVNDARKKKAVQIDLETCSNITQLEIMPTGVENEIKFVFKCIKKKHPEEPHSFQLFIDEKYDYSVSYCSPPLQEVNLLVNQLNDDRDIYTFIKRMRKAFVDQAAT